MPVIFTSPVQLKNNKAKSKLTNVFALFALDLALLSVLRLVLGVEV